MKKSGLPPTDAELASHELTQRIKDARIVAEQEQERADEPERMAMDALASVLSSRPLEPDEAPQVLPPAVKPRKPTITKAKPKPTTAELPATPDDAYRLMDAVFKKWSANYAKNPREANRELARDLGSDTAIYLRAQILRLPDMLDAINKLGMLKAEKGDDGQEEDVEAAIESWRAQMRGEK